MKRKLCALPSLVLLGSQHPSTVRSAGAERAINSAPTRRVNVPYTPGLEQVPVAERAIFWFGAVDPPTNYADTRLIYKEELLLVTIHVIDRVLWYDKGTPLRAELEQWDAADARMHSGKYFVTSDAED